VGNTARGVQSIKEEVEKANRDAVERMMESEPYWIDMDLAIKAIPGMRDYMLLHAGPPITYERASGPLKGALIGAATMRGGPALLRRLIECLEGGKLLSSLLITSAL
jgi:hypothetical protein